MFGYVTIAGDTLSKEEQARYRAYYCGLCRTLRERHGSLARLTLSYDATFLLILLSSLYEPEETAGEERCAIHPVKPHPYVINRFSAYCADMNIALSYHKCRDDWQDEHRLDGLAEMKLLEKAYGRIAAAYPDKCAALESSLAEIGRMEREGEMNPDALANQSALLLGVLYRWREDEWADSLQRMGEALGRFIYLMDAYDDLPRDIRHNQFNPLKALSQREDYESFCRESLTLLIAEGAQEFEALPLIQDAEILRNVLYAGCWGRYRMKQKQRDKDKPAEVKE